MRALLLNIGICCVATTWVACSTPQTSSQANPPSTPQTQSNGDPEASALAEREMVRRQNALDEANKMIEEGDRQRAGGDLEGATRTYQKSLDTIP